MARSNPNISARVACIALLFAGVAGAQEFSIQFASPVAAQSYRMKQSAFVFRTLGCADPSTPEVAAIAEGLVNYQRRSVPLKILPAQTPNVYGIFREWPSEGAWVVSLKAKCGAKSAGAIVVTDEKGGFAREASTVLNHAPTAAEVEAALKSGKKTAP
ncbi:MAG TPA: hypothetical protein VER03_08595 [Bryobacteraceae bacterium]|nr:hypothetical protein [Bryobacteraceae bacterium]